MKKKQRNERKLTFFRCSTNVFCLSPRPIMVATSSCFRSIRDFFLSFRAFSWTKTKETWWSQNVKFAEITLNFYELRLLIILCALFDINLDLWPKAWFQNDLKKVFQLRLIFLLFVLQRDPFPPTWWLPSTHNQIWRLLRPWKCQNFRHPVSKFSFHHNSKCVSCSFYWRL